RSKTKERTKAAVQTGARTYPAPPFRQQHQKKPGAEVRLHPLPLYDAPYYRGSGKLLHMAALITGAASGIGRAVAVLYASDGPHVAIVYLTEHEDAQETKRAVEAEGRRCVVMAGDVADMRFCQAAIKQTLREFGKLDILVNNAAFQEHATRIEDL